MKPNRVQKILLNQSRIQKTTFQPIRIQTIHFNQTKRKFILINQSESKKCSSTNQNLIILLSQSESSICYKLDMTISSLMICFFCLINNIFQESILNNFLNFYNPLFLLESNFLFLNICFENLHFKLFIPSLVFQSISHVFILIYS